MNIFEAALAAALLDRQAPRRSTVSSDILRGGYCGLARLALATLIIISFVATLEIVSRVAAPTAGPLVANGQSR